MSLLTDFYFACCTVSWTIFTGLQANCPVACRLCGSWYEERSTMTTSKTCDGSCEYITTASECGEAAAAFGWGAQTPEQYESDSELHGCYLQVESSAMDPMAQPTYTLRLNTGSPNAVLCSSDVCACKCSAGEPMIYYPDRYHCHYNLTTTITITPPPFPRPLLPRPLPPH